MSQIYLYSFSTIPQILVALVALLAIFVVYRMSQLLEKMCSQADDAIQELDKLVKNKNEDTFVGRSKRQLTGALHFKNDRRTLAILATLATNTEETALKNSQLCFQNVLKEVEGTLEARRKLVRHFSLLSIVGVAISIMAVVELASVDLLEGYTFGRALLCFTVGATVLFLVWAACFLAQSLRGEKLKNP